ncbi:Crp/Fnr family transcriptional regulator [Phenylobacterium deserti]|uniref:Crp/Fnr family transcriptional regulator n=1 Tax=Phenylobacterium deserti TaxID=1914756 RepID=A0A328ADF9_9CAUL|nr:Crp/Fnr family transcriptional regulator [Phenylobacterium deserti]RAK52699.1 Crp/Fnr family transcriptional regulator [Phenylobacterium deserti]
MKPTSPNLLLAELEPAALSKLEHRARRIEAHKGDVLQHPEGELQAVFFPETAVLSVAAGTSAGESVDVTLVGSEGVFGAFEACGSQRVFSRLAVHLPGNVLRVPASAYRELFDQSPALRNAVHRYVELLLIEARQFVACNALHSVENRLARALLDTNDRSGTPLLMVTQDALAQLLGVQRTTIAAAVSTLQRAGLIRSGRGALELLDLPGLEQAACSCRESLSIARRGIWTSARQACEA